MKTKTHVHEEGSLRSKTIYGLLMYPWSSLRFACKYFFLEGQTPSKIKTFPFLLETKNTHWNAIWFDHMVVVDSSSNLRIPDTIRTENGERRVKVLKSEVDGMRWSKSWMGLGRMRLTVIQLSAIIWCRMLAGGERSKWWDEMWWELSARSLL